jgi:hypothetical protein
MTHAAEFLKNVRRLEMKAMKLPPSGKVPLSTLEYRNYTNPLRIKPEFSPLIRDLGFDFPGDR